MSVTGPTTADLAFADLAADAPDDFDPGPPLSPYSGRDNRLEYLSQAWLRLPGFLRESLRLVEPDHFDQKSEAQYLAIWLVVADLTRRVQEITRETVEYEVQELLDRRELELSLQQIGDLLDPNEGLISAAFRIESANLPLPHLRNVLKQFLRERAVMWSLRRLGAGMASEGEDLEAVLERLSQTNRRIEAADGLPMRHVAAVYGTPLPPTRPYVRTGIGFIDGPLGGQRPGDVNAILGFQGSGKSLIAGQLVVESARLASHDGSNGPWSVLLTYEESAHNVAPRLQSGAMRIDRNRLPLTEWDHLTEHGRTLEYERALLSSERERWEHDSGWLNAGVALMDMSGSEECPTAGNGGVLEIVAYLERLAQDTGRGIRTVVIDWALPLVERAMTKDDDLRRKLEDLGDALRRLVAERFQATVWITHQLRSAAGKRPSDVHHHNDAMEAKGFCMHMPNCGVLSSQVLAGEAVGVRRFIWSKHRSVPDSEIRPLLLKPHRWFAEFEDVTDLFDDRDGGLTLRIQGAER